MPVLSRINDVLERLAMALAVLLLIACCLVVGWETFSRYVLQDSLSWAEEAARLAFIWSLFLGAAVAFRRNEHLAVEALGFRVGSVAWRVHDALVQLLNLIVLAFFAGLGWRLAQTGFDRSFVSLPLPVAVGWGAIPFMGALGALFALERLLSGPGADRDPDSPGVPTAGR